MLTQVRACIQTESTGMKNWKERWEEQQQRMAEVERGLENGFYWAKWYGSGEWSPVRVWRDHDGVGVWSISSPHRCRVDQFVFGARIEKSEGIREFQLKVVEWFKICFGDPPDPKASNPRQRAARFAEEAIELMQAAELSREEVIQLVDYVYSRPSGEILDESSGVLTTLAMLTETHGIPLDQCADHGIRMLYVKIEKVRAKHRSMEPSSVIPGEYRG